MFLEESQGGYHPRDVHLPNMERQDTGVAAVLDARMAYPIKPRLTGKLRLEIKYMNPHT